MEFILEKPELSIAGVHMYEDKDGKMYFMAVKEPFETIYLETTEESAFDDLYQFMEETDVICGYGLSDEITFFINKTCMDKGRIPSYRVIDIKDLLYELYEVSEEAEKDLNYIYTDVWVSMGEPDAVWQERIEQLSPYRVTMELMENAGEQAVFMHCLPAFHDLGTVIGREIYEQFGIDCMEVTHEVIEGPKSIVFDEAENRMHTIKAVMAATL